MSKLLLINVLGLVLSCGVLAEERSKGKSLYVPPSAAKDYADAHKKGNEREQALQIEREIASQPQAVWSTNPDITHIKKAVIDALNKKQVFTLVVYNLPDRDNGQHSAGGVATYGLYKKYIDDLTRVVDACDVIVIIEPDALMLLHTLSEKDQKERCEALRYAVYAFKKSKNAHVYLDAGHSNWHSPQESARRLKLAGIEEADGFALNVSNFRKTSELTAFAEKVSKYVGGKHCVIDTSRNGNGPLDSKDNDPWCNPPGRALGVKPTFDTNNILVDAFLWIKHPGESDGECRGGPKAGTFWLEYAVGLIKNKK
jgi:endoglucanase